jgi:CHAT domain-containing protein
MNIPPELRSDIQRASQMTAEYQRTGQVELLDQAIMIWEHILASTSFQQASQDFQLAAMTETGGVLLRRYWARGEVKDLSQAIDFTQQAVDLADDDHPNKAAMLNNLATMLTDRYKRCGKLADLKVAIQSAQQAVDLTPNGSLDQAVYLSNLGRSLVERYKDSNNLQDLEDAISAAQQAVDLTPDGSPNQVLYLNNLGAMLADRYKRSDELADLEEAISAAQQAVDLTPDESPDKAFYLGNLGNRLSDLYDRSGQLADLEEAISISQQVLALTPYGSPDQARHLTNLSIMLADCYKRCGKLTDVEEAISAAQQAVDLTPEGSPDKAGRLNNLGIRLADYYDRSGDFADLERAISAVQQAVALTPEGSLHQAMHLNSLSAMLGDRYKHSRDPQDLEEAISAAQQAVALTPDGSPYKAGRLANLGNRLNDRYYRSNDLADLEEAVSAAKQALALTPHSSPDKAGHLHNLGNRLTNRYEYSNDLADLKEAISAAQQAVKLTPENSPNKAGYLNNLGYMLVYRFKRSGQLADLKDLKEGQRLFQQAIQLGKLSSPDTVIKASRSWGRWALERREWEESAEAFQPGLETIDLLVRQHALRSSKEDWLREAQGIPAQYAYALQRTGNTSQALQVIESGRARLLSEQLALGQLDLSALGKTAPALAERYSQLSQEITYWRSEELQKEHSPEKVRSELRRLDQELQETIQRIQKTKGFAHFMADVNVNTIFETAAEQPLAYLAATPAGGMTLIVLPNGQVETLWRDALSQDALSEQMQGPREGPRLHGYLGAYQQWKQSLDMSSEEKDTAFADWKNALDSITHWLWQTCMRDLTTWLKNKGYSACRLVPTGLLSLLPLHAAWTEDPTSDIGRRYALDEVLFTYAPNAQALHTAQKKATNPADSILLTEDPNAGHPQHGIPFSPEVAQSALEHFRDSQIHLSGEQADRLTVLEKMPQAAVLHFWTHGLSIPQEPLDSSLLMAGEEHLTLRDILQLDLPKARLAFLSACETSMVGFRNIDEVVSLPTGLIQAGVPGVIGSLWSVAAVSTMMLVAKFYEVWKEQKVHPTEALRETQIWLRDSRNDEKEGYYEDWVEKADQGGALLMPAEVARAALREIMLKDPEGRSFSHPFFWAAFGYYGM